MPHHAAGTERLCCRWAGALAFVLLLCGAPKARAAVVTITDCVADPHIVTIPSARQTAIDVGANDLVLACELHPAPAVGDVVLRGHDVTVGSDVTSDARGLAVSITASGRFLLEGASIVATNGNASIRITSSEDATFTGGSVIAPAGDLVDISCTQAGQGDRRPCDIVARKSQFRARRVNMTAEGNIYYGLVEVATFSPRDYIKLTAKAGDAKMAGCDNIIRSGAEGNLDLIAGGSIDLAFAQVLVAENINIVSGVGATQQGIEASIRLAGATVSNDFGKRGSVTILADEGQAQINICGATIIDDGTGVSSMNGRTQLPHDGFNNVMGPPDTDS